MYADRANNFRPIGFGAAFAVNGAIVAAMVFLLAPNIVERVSREPLTTFEVPDAPPPPPPIPTDKPVTDSPRADIVYAPPVEVTTRSDNTEITTDTRLDVTPPPNPGLGTGTGTGEAVIEKPVVPPLIAAAQDPRYARDFQPDYPGPEIRLGREGVVSVRVLIGTDGRVKAVEQVSATSRAFFDATRRQALEKWRFKPATRGGIPQESWKTMNVRFELSGG